MQPDSSPRASAGPRPGGVAGSIFVCSRPPAAGPPRRRGRRLRRGCIFTMSAASGWARSGASMEPASNSCYALIRFDQSARPLPQNLCPNTVGVAKRIGRRSSRYFAIWSIIDFRCCCASDRHVRADQSSRDVPAGFGDALAVNFQEVVHSIQPRSSDVTTTSVILRSIEWTFTRMHA